MHLGKLAFALALSSTLATHLAASSPARAQSTDPLVVGCSDGVREGFVDQSTYATIAACGGAWTVAGVFKDDPACSREAGNTGINAAGTGCNVEDLCAGGWHVCYGPDDIQVRTGGRGCADAVAANYPNNGTGVHVPGGAFFITRTSGSGTGNCDEVVNGLPQSFNDIFGCGNMGGTPVTSNCSPLNKFGNNQCIGLRNNVGGTYNDVPAASYGYSSSEYAWYCNDNGNGTNESKFVVKSRPGDQGGVMCCKDTDGSLPEICDSVDNDADTFVDEVDFVGDGSANQFPGDPCTQTNGQPGTIACNGAGGWICAPIPAQACCMAGAQCSARAPAACTAAGGHPMGAATTCGTTTCPECYTDADCAATNEVCSPTGTCEPCLLDATPNDGDTDRGCAGQPTNACEARTGDDACVDCLNDTDCNVAGDVCRTATDTCVACVDNNTGGTRDLGCEAPANQSQPLCNDTNLAAPVCVACEDSNPTANTTPDDGCTAAAVACKTSGGPATCVECTADGHCGAGKVCNTATNTCTPCLDNATYPTNDAGCTTAALPICEASLNPRSCVECRNSTADGGVDEGCSAALPACSIAPTGTPNDCVECLSTADCTDTNEVCDTATKTCVPCLNDATVGNVDVGCSAVINACRVQAGDDVCVDCLATGDCQTAGDVCTAQNTCTPCVDNNTGGTRDLGCESNQPPLCNDSGAIPTCVTCEDTNAAATPTPDDGCVAATPACNVSAVGGPACVECLADGHCGAGKVCDTTNNTCVPCRNDQSGATQDGGCGGAEPICNDALDPNECVACIDDRDPSGVVPDTGCSAALPACDDAGVTTTVCVECLQDADCLAGEVCDEAHDTCVPCVDNLPIGSLPTPDDGCVAAAPLCELSSGASDPTECVVCQQTAPTSDVDPGCSAGAPDCEIAGATRRCLGCLTDSDCNGDQICHQGACIVCLDDEVYPDTDRGCSSAERICHLPQSTAAAEPTNLVGDECVACRDDAGNGQRDTGCAIATPICDALRQSGEVCVECLVDADCGAGELCDETINLCVPCVDSAPVTGQDDGCTVADPICDDRGATGTETCEECLDTSPTGQDLGCAAATPVCDEAAAGGHDCVECTQDTDCGAGETCQASSHTCGRCFDDASFPTIDSGCDQPKPVCVEQGTISGGGTVTILTCVVCDDDEPLDTAVDEGCAVGRPICNENVPGGACVECNDSSDCAAGETCDAESGACVGCVDDRLAGTVDGGCTEALPVCFTDDAAGPGDDHCVACEDDQQTGLADWGCDAAARFCDVAAAGGPTCVACEDDGDCEADFVCSGGACVDVGTTEAVDDAYETDEGVALVVSSAASGVAGNDLHPPGSAVVIALEVGTGPSADEGTLVLNADGTFTFTPAAGFAGVVAFGYTLTAALNGSTSSATVTIVVDGPPRPADDVAATTEDSAVTFDPRDNDVEPNGESLTLARIVTPPAHGTAVISGDGGGRITFTPEAGWSGADALTYEVCDAGGKCATARVVLTVAPVNDAPIAGDDIATTPEDTAVLVVVLANDGDVDSPALEVRRIVSQPTHGAVVIQPDDSVRYTPRGDYSGDDAFTYEVCDELGQCDVAVVLVHVAPENDAPQAGDDATTTPGATPVTVDVLANDGDKDGDTLTIARIATPPASGTARIETAGPNAGTITYTPGAATTGAVTFVYEVCDLELCDTATVTITVGVDNEAPRVDDDQASTALDTPVSIAVLDNDSDGDGDALTVTQAGVPSSGVVVIGGDGALVYTPAAGFTGEATFTYTACDGRGACETARVTVTVLSAENRPPIATDDVVSTRTGTPVSLDPSDNDVDPDGDPLAVDGIVDGPAHGTARVESDGRVTYTPAAGFVGVDSFSVSIADGFGGFAESTVTVHVAADANRAPVAADDRYTVSSSAPSTLAVLGNDSDPDGDTIAIVDVVQGGKGVVTVSVVGGVTALLYTPNAGASGTDTFTYTISDGRGGVDQATVTLTLQSGPIENGAPDARDDSVTTAEDTGVLVAVLGNDSDPDGDVLAVSAVTVAPRHGTATVDASGVMYVPAGDYHGPDVFTVRVCDPDGACDEALVAVTVTPVDDAPRAGDDAYAVPDGEATTLPVTLNDSDPEGGTLTVTIVMTANNGELTVNEDGTVTYTPGAPGADGFTYRVCDEGGNCDEAEVELVVGGDNGNPVALDDEAATSAEEPVVVDVLDNDRDPDGDALTITAVEDPAHGTATIVGDTVEYVPDADFVGGEVFFYTVCDADGACATALVMIEVEAGDDAPPVAVDDVVTTPAGRPVTFDATANDSDPDGDALRVASVGDPAHGTVVINPDGTLTYTPDEGFVGEDGFDVTITDDAGGTATARVRVVVTAVSENHPPDAIDDAYDAPSDRDSVFEVLANDSDPDGDALTISGVTQPAHGAVTIGDNGTLVFTPDADYIGVDRFSYTVDDGYGGSDTAWVDVVIGDRDHDGLGDGHEVDVTHTDPDVFDTDGDGLGDGDEVGGGDDPLAFDPGVDTDPIDADTDDDGLSDGSEVEREEPLDPNDPDSDDDGVRDGVELGVTEPVPGGVSEGGVPFGGSDPAVFVPDADPTTTTDPNDDDSDDDGLTDGHEDLNGNGRWDGEIGGTGTAGSGETDAARADTDGDGVQDGTELGLTAPEGSGTDLSKFQPDLDTTTTTDPRDSDSDDGGVPDGDEDDNGNGYTDPGEIDPNVGADDTLVEEAPGFVEGGACSSGAAGMLLGLAGLAGLALLRARRRA